MADSPKSDVFNSRFSTPVNELDDHRNQPESLPRTDASNGQAQSGTRRGTRRSTANAELPGLLIPDMTLSGTTARDFEQAIEDDEKSDNGSVGVRALDRLTPISPANGRRNTFRRPRNVVEEMQNRSRKSSVVSERSLSPPNSVDAFAEPRRRPRAGTINTVHSQAPSFLELHRTHSGGSFQRRCTFSEDKTRDASVAGSSHQGSVEDDVCFPQSEEPSVPFAIDFDDLNEFVASRNNRSTPVVYPFGSKELYGVPIQQLRVFNDVRQNRTGDCLPEKNGPVVTPYVSHGNTTIGSSPDLNEKLEQIDNLPARTFQESVNRWSFFSSELEETIHAPELADLLMPGESFEHLFGLGPDGGVWWLDIMMPSEDEVDAICKAFNIHGLTREDIITQETREKVELFKSYYFVCFRSFYQMDKNSEYYMEPVNVYAVVFREGVITFTFCPSPHAANVRKRMGKLRDYVALGADWICYALIDDIVDTYQPVIRQVEHESETIEDGIFTARPEDSRDVLRQIGECRKKVMSLIRLLGGKADVIKGFAKRCNEQYSIAPRQDVGMYLSDIQDHVVTMMSNLAHFEKMLSRSHANYLAQISVDNMVAGNKANQALSKVTFIATVLVPMNLVCGLFGMNVPVPGRSTDGLEWFFGIVGVLVAFAILSFIIAKRARYI